jgi:hypothetical protein
MKKQANNKTEEILNSLDGIKKIQAPDFFYTRLKAKMKTSPPIKQTGKIFGPVYVIAFLALLIVFNLISLIKQNNAQNNTISAEPENSQTIASAYNLDDNLSYELNQ